MSDVQIVDGDGQAHDLAEFKTNHANPDLRDRSAPPMSSATPSRSACLDRRDRRGRLPGTACAAYHDKQVRNVSGDAAFMR